MSAVGALGEQAPVCLPSVTATSPPGPTTTGEQPGKKHHGDDEQGNGKGKGKGHEK